MFRMPFFSVIIPLYNKEEYISECLKSALSQTFDDFEIVIMDDGSTDNSASLANNFKSDKINLHHQENQGASEARNNAVKLSSGKYMAFLDADDIWEPDHLQRLSDSINSFPNSGIYTNNYSIKFSESLVKPAILNFDYSGNKPFKVDDFFKASMKDTVVWTSACCIEKTKFIEYGMFNPIYLSSQDLDMWIRIALKESVIFNPSQTMIYNHSIANSLGKVEDNDARFILLSSFNDEEKTNPSLKAYLDLKRYGLALRTKINGEEEISRKTLSLIETSNLSTKQKLLLKIPVSLLRVFNKVRPYLIKNRLYQTIFKG